MIYHKPIIKTSRCFSSLTKLNNGEIGSICFKIRKESKKSMDKPGFFFYDSKEWFYKKDLCICSFRNDFEPPWTTYIQSRPYIIPVLFTTSTNIHYRTPSWIRLDLFSKEVAEKVINPKYNNQGISIIRKKSALPSDMFNCLLDR